MKELNAIFFFLELLARTQKNFSVIKTCFLAYDLETGIKEDDFISYVGKQRMKNEQMSLNGSILGRQTFDRDLLMIGIIC